MCLKYVSVLILVNGSPTKKFRPTRGLRQGEVIHLPYCSWMVGWVGQRSL